jgi:hypothetical protein
MHSGHLKALEPLSLPQPITALLIGAARRQVLWAVGEQIQFWHLAPSYLL